MRISSAIWKNSPRRWPNAAQINSLAQTLVKLTAPGVPDIYQGNELWDFSLVDPDNRRPVDFELRQQIARGSKESFRRRNLEAPRRRFAKIVADSKHLAVADECLDIFSRNYEPIVCARRKRRKTVVAFLRGGKVIDRLFRDSR